MEYWSTASTTRAGSGKTVTISLSDGRTLEFFKGFATSIPNGYASTGLFAYLERAYGFNIYGPGPYYPMDDTSLFDTSEYYTLYRTVEYVPGSKGKSRYAYYINKARKIPIFRAQRGPDNAYIRARGYYVGVDSTGVIGICTKTIKTIDSNNANIGIFVENDLLYYQLYCSPGYIVSSGIFTYSSQYKVDTEAAERLTNLGAQSGVYLTSDHIFDGINPIFQNETTPQSMNANFSTTFIPLKKLEISNSFFLVRDKDYAACSNDEQMLNEIINAYS